MTSPLQNKEVTGHCGTYWVANSRKNARSMTSTLAGDNWTLVQYGAGAKTAASGELAASVAMR